MKAALVALTLLALTGCANTQDRAWYGQSFVGYRLTEGGFESCSKENAGIRLGHVWRVSRNFTVAAEYEHVSHLLCGRPFNIEGHEDFTDHVGVVVTYGGLQ